MIKYEKHCVKFIQMKYQDALFGLVDGPLDRICSRQESSTIAAELVSP